MSENRSLSNATPVNSEDEVVRRLRKRPFEEVYKAMEKDSSNRGSSGTNVTKVHEILDEYGWTQDEFIDGIIKYLRSNNGSERYIQQIT